MRTRTRRALWIAAVLVAVQAAIFLAYRAARPAARSPESVQRAFAPVAVAALAAPLPALTVDVRGEARQLSIGPRPTVVHFWATWCKPCREELPELLALAHGEDLGVDFAIVSVDESWEVIDHYFGGRAPAPVVRASRDSAGAAFGVDVLPASFLVDAAGRLRFRLLGAQAWSAPAARAWITANASTMQ